MGTFPVEVSFPVHWAELDALGHVNNARYFTWFETARMELFQRVGLATTGLPKIGPILAQTECRFKAPVQYPATVQVGTRVARLGNTSFVMDYRAALEAKPEEAVAEGSGVVVMFDYQGGAKVPIPTDLRARLADLG
ncbi:MAG: thioesterase family protein [Acidobacteriota bacterium]